MKDLQFLTGEKPLGIGTTSRVGISLYFHRRSNYASAPKIPSLKPIMRLTPGTHFLLLGIHMRSVYASHTHAHNLI